MTSHTCEWVSSSTFSSEKLRPPETKTTAKWQKRDQRMAWLPKPTPLICGFSSDIEEAPGRLGTQLSSQPRPSTFCPCTHTLTHTRHTSHTTHATPHHTYHTTHTHHTHTPHIPHHTHTSHTPHHTYTHHTYTTLHTHHTTHTSQTIPHYTHTHHTSHTSCHTQHTTHTHIIQTTQTPHTIYTQTHARTHRATSPGYSVFCRFPCE